MSSAPRQDRQVPLSNPDFTDRLEAALARQPQADLMLLDLGACVTAEEQGVALALEGRPQQHELGVILDDEQPFHRPSVKGFHKLRPQGLGSGVAR
jgi:hypothetical protein